MSHYLAAFELWSFMFRMVGIQWVLLEKVLDLLCGWRCRGLNIWNLVPVCLMWTIWTERDQHTFEDVECKSTKLQAFFTGSLYKWSFVSGITGNSSVQSFIE